MLLYVFIVDSDFLQGVKKVFGSDEKKEFVDPYFLAGFAGTKVCACFFSSITLQSELKVKKTEPLTMYLLTYLLTYLHKKISL